MTESALPVPRSKLVSARMVLEYSDGSSITFTAHDPEDAEIDVERSMLDVVRDPGFVGAEPDLIRRVLPAGSITGVVLRIKAARGREVSYQDSAAQGEHGTAGQ